MAGQGRTSAHPWLQGQTLPGAGRGSVQVPRCVTASPAPVLSSRCSLQPSRCLQVLGVPGFFTLCSQGTRKIPITRKIPRVILEVPLPVSCSNQSPFGSVQFSAAPRGWMRPLISAGTQPNRKWPHPFRSMPIFA